MVLRGWPLSGSSPAPSKALWVALQRILFWQRKQTKQLGNGQGTFLKFICPTDGGEVGWGMPKARPQQDSKGQHSPFPLVVQSPPPHRALRLHLAYRC